MRYPFFFKTVLISSFFLTLSMYGWTQDKPQAKYGQLHLGDWDFEKQGSIKLDGTWHFYWNKVLTPTDFVIREPKGRSSFEFPQIWNDYPWDSTRLPAQGYATYRLQVIGKVKGYNLAMEIPDMYCSYNLWVNGKLLARNGVVGTTKEETVPQWIPLTESFTADKDTLDILLSISNFHHSKGGNKDSIVLGLAAPLLSKRNSDINANLILVVGLLILSIICVKLYFKHSDVLFVLFAIISFSWALRGMFTSMYIMNFWFPELSWTIGTKIEYIVLYLMMLLGVHIIGKMYSEHANRIARYVSTIINSIYIIIALVSPTALFSKMQSTYLVFAVLFMLYIISIIITAHIHEKKGADYISLGILLIILLFFYDLFAYQGIIPYSPYITSFGYLIVYYINAFGLWHRITHDITEEPRMY